MKPKFSEEYPPLTLDEINIFEAKIGYKLPQSYKEFLLNHNGGKIEIRKFDDYKNEKNPSIGLYHKIIFEDGEELYHTLFTFSTIDIEEPSIIDQNDEYSQETYELELYGDYGVHLLIGSGLDYSTTTISLNDKDYGAIYRFDDHADYEETYKNCAKISDSFEEFYNSFEFYEI